MFYLFLLAHLVADFMLQPYWLVQRKRRWDGLLIHGGIVLACMLLLPLVDARALGLWPAMLGITAVHIAADWWKVRHGDRIPGPPIVPFLLDQAIHLTTLAVALGVALPAHEVWPVAASPAAPGAVLLAGYVTALLAVPIAVMVWLDPRFEHVAIAGRARLRSLVASAAVITVALLGGTLALPATLAGMLLLVGRPRSVHPLDAPLGIATVLFAAALLGALLQLAL